MPGYDESMPIIEPRVNAEKLAELRLEGHESEGLDFKATLNLDDRRETVEFAKDVGAMQISGGFIAVGMTEDGTPSGMLDDRMAALFDEATVRGKLRRYIPEPMDIRVAVHVIDGNHTALVYVGPNPAGFCVFRADGALPDGRLVFRAGDVFARHGSASERWRQEDIPVILDRIVATQKEAWRREIGEVLAAQLAEGQAHQRIAAGPLEGLSWQLDEETYSGAVSELLRSGDKAGRRTVELALTRAVRELVAAPEREEDLGTALDRAVATIAAAVTLGEPQDVDQAARFLVRLYNLGDDDRLHANQPARLWYGLLQRIEAVGALAVRLERWETLPLIVVRAGTDRNFGRYPNWLVHASYAAGNARLMDEQRDGQRLQTPVLRSAAAWVARTTIARPDLPDDIEDEGVADTLLGSLCQFDFLASVIGAHAAGRADWTTLYPHFARFYSYRTTPIAERLVRDPDLRSSVYPGTDEALASALANINAMASRVSQHAGWDGYESDIVERFIARNLTAPVLDV
jgi:hypothetical protein